MGKTSKMDLKRTEVDAVLHKMDEAQSVLQQMTYESQMDCLHRSYTFCQQVAGRAVVMRWAIEILMEQRKILEEMVKDPWRRLEGSPKLKVVEVKGDETK